MRSPSRPAVFIHAGLKNTTIRNASANQGHTARGRTRATARRAGWGGCELQQAGAPGKLGGSKDLSGGSRFRKTWKERGLLLEVSSSSIWHRKSLTSAKGHCSAVSNTMPKNAQPKSFTDKDKASCYLQAILDTRKLAYVSINSSNRLSKKNERQLILNLVHGLLCRQNMLPALL